MTTLFISDLHLDEKEPQITELFLQFLKTQASKADALYILGDLFEVWIGDDEQSALQQTIQHALFELTRQVPVYFIHGNRDFLLGKQFAQAAGMTLLPEQTIIDLYGKKALIMHGDTLCTRDINYQNFRRKIRQPWIQKLFLCLPLSLRKKIASKLRQGSQQHTMHTQADIMDVTPEEVVSVMQNHQVDLLIHGHTHRANIHQEKASTRIVLDAWHTHGNVLIYNKDHSFNLFNF